MRYWLDTEFHDHGRVIDLISLGGGIGSLPPEPLVEGACRHAPAAVL